MCKYPDCKLSNLLHQYMQRMIFKYENDIIVLDNNVRFRDSDPVDHLDMIMARVRLQTISETYSDIIKIIEISKGL